MLNILKQVFPIEGLTVYTTHERAGKRSWDAHIRLVDDKETGQPDVRWLNKIGTWACVLRVVVTETTDGTCRVWDVAEQVVQILPNGACEDNSSLSDRAKIFLVALSKVIQQVLSNWDLSGGAPLPFELFTRQVLAAFNLKTPNTKEEFEQALMVESRLGKYLPTRWAQRQRKRKNVLLDTLESIAGANCTCDTSPCHPCQARKALDEYYQRVAARR